MSTLTVLDLSTELKKPVDELIAQLKDAGVSVKNQDSPITPDDKLALLGFLQKGRGQGNVTSEPRRITLKRKETSELKLGRGRGVAAKTVSIEVRKRRTYVKREEVEEVKVDVEELEPSAETVPEPNENAVTSPPEDNQLAQQETSPEQDAESPPTPDLEEPAPSAAKEISSAGNARISEEPPEKPTAEGPVDRARLEAEASRKRAEENLRRASQIVSPPPPHSRRQDKHERVERESKHGQRDELHLAAGRTSKRDSKKRRRAGGKVQVENLHVFEKPTAPVVREVEIPEAISVGDLAGRMAVKATELIKAMMKNGVMATINQVIDQDTAAIMVEEMGHKVKLVNESDVEDTLIQAVSSESQDAAAVPRPPVVTILGHVDHGKTSLLDYMRKTRVASGEAGGITQHIGAYHVDTPKGVITFLDTPGHAAFTRMRARGAQITDIVVLVVAADDGVMPQTREAIQHARAAKVPMVVAITKSDKAEADPEKVKTELSKEEIIPEEWGGDYQVVNVSSHTGEGVDDLLDAVLVQAEVLELKAPVESPARGSIVEASIEKGRGPVATVLVRSGTLRQGDVILTGSHYGRVRAMFNETGSVVKSAGPSIPVEVLGLNGAPDAGDEVIVVSDERKARELAELREGRERDARLAQTQAVRMEQVFREMDGGEQKPLNLLIKADVQGSSEALTESLRSLPSEEVKINIIASGIGSISESDIDLALASQATIIGFNVRADSVARRRIQDSGIDVRYYSIIYDVIEDVSAAISGLLGTETREQIVGTAEVRDVFRSSKFGDVAGCLIVEGEVRRGLPIRVLRSNTVIYEGELESLRRHKDDVNKVVVGTECGIAVKNYMDVRSGDQIECFERVQVQRKVKTDA